jgi:hypothetical protein
MSNAISIDLTYLTYGSDNSVVGLVYFALESERERLITEMVQSHIDGNYEQAASNAEEIEKLTNKMGAIARSLMRECERLHYEIQKIQKPKVYEEEVQIRKDHPTNYLTHYFEQFDPKMVATEGGSNE